MQKAKDAKIKSAPKRPNKIIKFNQKFKYLIVLLCVLSVLGITVYVLIFSTSETSLNANGHKYNLLVSKTSQALEKGLGGRPSLPLNQGMLFVFSGEATRCFWMKNMKFSLDIIWLNSNKEVVNLLQDLSPLSYPKVFCPIEPAMYVIELNSGQIKYANMKIGEKLQF